MTSGLFYLRDVADTDAVIAALKVRECGRVVLLFLKLVFVSLLFPPPFLCVIVG